MLFSVGTFEVATKTGRFAQMYMVDLAGSEVVSKTKAVGQRLEEVKCRLVLRGGMRACVWPCLLHVCLRGYNA